MESGRSPRLVMEPSRKPLNGLWNGFASSLDLHDGTGVTDKKRQRLSGDAVSFDKRINELQGQLIESNERAHTLESFVKQQQLWLEQEREAHAETQDEMTRTQGELARTRLAASELADAQAQERFMYQMQLAALPELEEQVRTMEEQQERQLREETIRLTKEFQGSLIRVTGQMKLEMDKRLASERKRDLESVAQKMAILEDENRDLGAQNMQLAIHRQMADDRAEELQRTLAAVTDDLHAERTVAFDMAHDLHTLEEQLKESNNQLAMVQLNLHETSETLGGERDTLKVQLESVNGQLTLVDGQLTLVDGQLQTTKSELELCRQELHDAYVEASRLGEELQEEKKQTKAVAVPVNDWRENDGLKLAIKELVDLACQLGDTHAEAPALTEKIGYSQWRAAVSEALRNLGHCGIANWKPHHRLVSGAVTVIGTLMPILYCLFKDAGQKNEKLIASYDKLTAHAKGLEAELDRCKCTDLRAEVVRLRNEIAQTEKEMMEAESLIHQQNGHNQDLSIRVKRRSALESVEVDGRSLLKDLVKVQDQRSQLTKQVEGLERSLAASRTAVEKLQTEKGDLTARLLEAEKQIPPPRALVYVKDLSENVEDLRRSLGPIGEQSCAQCTLYLGKAREAERRRDIAEKSVMEEQRRLVKMTQDSKLFLEAKIKSLEHDAQERIADDKKESHKLKKRLGEVEAKLGEADKTREKEVKAKEDEVKEQRKIAERRLAAKNEQIETLEAEAAQASVAKEALVALDNLLVTHRFRSAPLAERFRSAFHDATHAVHSRQTVLQIRGAYQRLEGVLREFAQWLRSDEAKDTRRDTAIIKSFVEQLERNKAILDAMPMPLDAKPVFSTLRSAWEYAVKLLMAQ